MIELSAEVKEAWSVIEPILTIRTEAEYDRAILQLNELLDLVGDNEFHPLYNLLDTLGTLVHVYEEKNYSFR